MVNADPPAPVTACTLNIGGEIAEAVAYAFEEILPELVYPQTLKIGALVMGFGVLVQLVTLPVELDASFRKALPVLEAGYLQPEQVPAARRILRAAAWTYVAASLAGLLNFWRWIAILRR